MASERKRLEDIVQACVEEAVTRQCVPSSVAAYAGSATIRRLGRISGPGLERRARAYFDAVCRRRVVKTRVGGVAAARAVADSVVSDLMSSGRTPAEAWEEIARGWSGALPAELIDEYRVKLCA